MRRVLVGVAAVVWVLMLTASSASAQTVPDRSRILGPLQGGNRVQPIDDGTNPALSCRQNDNMVLVEVAPGEFVPSELTSYRACVTSLALGRVSYITFVEQCRNLEPEFAATNESGQPYPYSFYGNPAYTAENRRDCVYFVWAFHTGLLPPGPGA